MIEFVEIKKSQRLNNDKPVYDIEVEDDHSFVVGEGLIVHNCTTRKMTGCGRPQLSTVIECADAAHQVGGMVCADGGITCPGDVCKAFGAGADFIMIGGMFAGTDEAEGDVVDVCEFTNEYKPSYYMNEKGCMSSEYSYFENNIPIFELDPKLRKSNPKRYKTFYGMSSTLAQEKFGNGKPSYRASEGRITLVPYSGKVIDVVEELLGGLRSTMTYIGARRLKDIPKQCVFYKVHNQLNRIYENTTIGK